MKSFPGGQGRKRKQRRHLAVHLVNARDDGKNFFEKDIAY